MQIKARPTMRGPAAALLGAGVVALSSCGSGGDYKNEPRPPAPINVTASISDKRVSVSPPRFGAGPIVLIVTNQTTSSQNVTLESDELGARKPGIEQSTGPINPRDTAQLKVDASEGRYTVGVDNSAIRPARLVVGPRRPSAQNQVLQP